MLRSESGELLGELAKSIGVATNNVAEYTALIEGLRMAHKEGVTHLEAHVDSPVVAGHLLHGHRVKAEHLRPLIEQVRGLLDLFPTSSLVRVPRASNTYADKLANRGIDEATTKADWSPSIGEKQRSELE